MYVHGVIVVCSSCSGLLEEMGSHCRHQQGIEGDFDLRQGRREGGGGCTTTTGVHTTHSSFTPSLSAKAFLTWQWR